MCRFIRGGCWATKYLTSSGIFEPLPEGRNFERKYFQPVGRAASGKTQAKEERAARKKNLKRFEP